jgi:hypothetical protein
VVFQAVAAERARSRVIQKPGRVGAVRAVLIPRGRVIVAEVLIGRRLVVSVIMDRLH